MKTIELTFHSFCRDEKKDVIPKTSGIYCVYVCEYSKSRRNLELVSLIYIGEAENLHDQIVGQDMLDEWKSHLTENQTLCYSFAEVDLTDMERAEAALIYKVRPEMNGELKGDRFGFEDTEIKTSGYNAYLPKKFTVRAGKKFDSYFNKLAKAF